MSPSFIRCVRARCEMDWLECDVQNVNVVFIDDSHDKITHLYSLSLCSTDDPAASNLLRPSSAGVSIWTTRTASPLGEAVLRSTAALEPTSRSLSACAIPRQSSARPRTLATSEEGPGRIVRGSKADFSVARTALVSASVRHRTECSCCRRRTWCSYCSPRCCKGLQWIFLLSSGGKRINNWECNLQCSLAASQFVDNDAAGEELALPEVRFDRELLLFLEVS